MATEFGGDRHGAQTTGAATGDQDRISGVDAFVDGQFFDGLDHVLVGDCQDRERGAHQGFAEAHSERFDSAPRGGFVELHASTKEMRRIDIAEHHGSIGDRSFGAAASVAGRAGFGAGRMGTDAQQATSINPRDGTAAGADRMYRDRSHAEVVADPLRAEPGLAREFHRAVTHQADVEGRAAGIADDDVAGEVLGGGIGKASDGCHGRARLHQIDRFLHHVAEVHHTAERRADQYVVVVAGRAQIGFECEQVLLHERFQRCIDGGR